MNRDIKKFLGSILASLISLYICDFTLFQSLIISLLALFYWEVGEIKFNLDALVSKTEEVKE